MDKYIISNCVSVIITVVIISLLIYLIECTKETCEYTAECNIGTAKEILRDHTNAKIIL